MADETPKPGIVPGRVTVDPVDPGKVMDVHNKDPRYVYRYVRNRGTMAEQNVDRKQLMGYKTVKSGDRERVGVPGNAGNVVQVGDMMLMKCPREVYDTREQKKREKDEAMVKRTDQKFREDMERLQHPAGRKSSTIVL